MAKAAGSTAKKTAAPRKNRNDQVAPDAKREETLAAGDAKARKTAKRDPRAAADATNLAKRLITHQIDELRALPRPWQQLSEQEQEDVITRLRKNSEELLAELVTQVASGGDFRKVILELSAVNTKAKTTVATLAIPTADTEGVHNLIDARGNMVALVLGVDPKTFGVGNDGVRAEPDQRPLV